MELLEFDETSDGVVTVQGATMPLYSWFDATVMAEYLRGVLEKTVRQELPRELRFLVRFRAAREAVDARVDLPDRLANLFIRLCRQNKGRISAAKRHLFDMLTDEQIAALQKAVADCFDETADV